MKTTTLTLLLQCAGLAHLGLIAAGAIMPRVVNLHGHIASLPDFVRRLFWVYYSFIGLCLVSFGALTFAFAEQLAGEGSLARAVCVFLAIFWTVRLYVAMFVFDLRPYLTSAWRRLGYYATNFVFGLLPVIYLAAAWKGAMP